MPEHLISGLYSVSAVVIAFTLKAMWDASQGKHKLAREREQLFTLLCARVLTIETTMVSTKDFVTLQLAFARYEGFMHQQGRRAAKVLDTDNPAPPDIRAILRKYYYDADLNQEEQ